MTHTKNIFIHEGNYNGPITINKPFPIKMIGEKGTSVLCTYDAVMIILSNVEMSNIYLKVCH